VARPGGALLGTLSLIVFLRVMGITLVVTGFLAYAATLGATPLEAGLALGAYPLALAVFLTPLGHLSDRYGRGRGMLVGLLVAALGSILAALAGTWWLLALGRFVSGAGAVNGIALAVAGESGEEGTRTRRFAVLGAAAGGGVVLGLVGGELLVHVVGMRWLLGGFAVANLLLVPLAFSMGDEATRRSGDEGVLVASSPPPDRLVFRIEPVALWLGSAAFCVNLSLTVLLARFEALVPKGANPPLLLLAMLVPAGLGMFVASRMADRGRTLAVGVGAATLLGLAPLAFLASGSGLWLVLAGGIVFFLGHSSLSSLLPSLLSANAAAGRRGAAQGVQSTLQYLGSFAGSLVAGAVAAALPLAVVFVASGLAVAWIVTRVASGASPA
jgi:MFS family permease